LFTKLQFTRYSQNILRPNLCTHGHIWSWTVVHFHRSRVFAIGFKGIKTRWWRVSSFSIAIEYNRALSVPTDNKSEGLSSGELGGFTSKSIFEYVPFLFPLRNSFLIFVQVFHVHPAYSSVNARHCLSHPHKTATKLYFSLSQYLRPWIAKCRHHFYNLLISRRSPKFFCSQFLSC